MKHDGAHCIVDGTNGTLSLAILLRSVRTRQTESGAVLCKKIINDRVKELGAVVRLHGTDGGTKLSAYIGEKFSKSAGDARFLA
jgi:hypothetical protein